MDYQNKTRKDLIKELQELQMEYDSLKTSYEKDITEHKLAEEALPEPGILYIELMDVIRDVIFSLTPQGLFGSLNQAFEKITGWQTQEWIGKPFTDLLHPEDIPLAAERFSNLLKGHTAQAVELRIRKKSGDYGWTEVLASPRMKKGMIIGLMGIGRDITERKQAEKALQESEEHYRILFNEAMDGICLADAETGLIIDCNQAMLSLVGRERAELIGQSQKILHPLKNNKTAYSPTFVQHLTDKEGKILETQIVTGTDIIREVEIKANLVNVYGRKALQGVFRDITERKRAEEALKESEKKYRILIDSMGEGVGIVDKEENFVFANPAAEKIFDVGPGELVGTALHRFLSSENLELVIKQTNKRRKRISSTYEHEIILSSGVKKHIIITATPKLGNNGEFLGTFAIFRDITERKWMEEELKAERKRLNDVLEIMPVMVCLLTPDYHVVFANRAFREKFGESHGRHCYEYCFEKKEPCNFCETYRVLKTGKPHHWQVTTMDGANVIEVLGFPFTKEDGSPLILEIDIDITERKRAEEDTRKSTKLLEDLHKHLDEIRENERAMISREIHDQIGQSLTALKLDLNWMGKYIKSADPEAVAKLGDMIELVTGTIKDVQRISSELRPGILDDLGLAAAIEWYCDEFEKRTAIKCSLRLDDSIFGDPRKNLVFFRVLQEALTNIIRHANASSVTIELHHTQKGTTLAIQDDGIGITREKVESAKSLGLIGMHERVKQFGGEIDFSAKEDRGTKLTVFIPEKKKSVE